MAEVRWSTSSGFRVRCDGRGFTVDGAGFTVWDERLSAALEAADQLRLPARKQRPEGPTDPLALLRALAPAAP